MAFKNKGRLPFYLSKPQYPVKEEVYIKSNGLRRVNSRTILKQFEGRTEWMPKEVHERLMIALRHDYVLIESVNFAGYFSIDGDYEIAWPDFQNFPLAPASFKGYQNGFHAQQDQCGYCKPDTFAAVDDLLTLNQGELGQGFNVAANDDLCIGVNVFSLTYVNLDVFANLAINAQTGGITYDVKPSIPSQSNVKVASYQIECGSDIVTADVYANIVGETCAVPVQGAPYFPDGNSITNYWDNPTPYPAGGLVGELYQAVGANYVLIDSFTTTDPAKVSHTWSGLAYNENFEFRLRAVCGVGFESADLIEPCSTGSPGVLGDMSISLFANAQFAGGQWNYDVQANITAPSGVAAGQTISIFFILEVNGVGYPGQIDIATNSYVGNHNSVAQTADYFNPVFTSAGYSPQPVLGNDGNNYNVIILY